MGTTRTNPPQYGSLAGHAVAAWAATCPDRTALRVPGGPSLSYAVLNERATRLAQALLAHGLTHGDRVAVWLGNRCEYIETYLACAKAGLVVVPVNIRFTAPEAQFVLTDSGARALVHDAAVTAAVTELGVDLHPCWQVGGSSSRGSDYESALLEGSSAALPDPHPDDLLVIGYTSGTTGQPKGAELTHRSVTHLGLTNAISCRYRMGSTQVFGLSLSFTATVPAHVLPHLVVCPWP